MALPEPYIYVYTRIAPESRRRFQFKNWVNPADGMMGPIACSTYQFAAEIRKEVGASDFNVTPFRMSAILRFAEHYGWKFVAVPTGNRLTDGRMAFSCALLHPVTLPTA